ncbi:MAG: CHRD domain-containing protein [Planctomycetes bacterium]|nr:CHRD domain-containing protein [Planctomycetota bacterium]
MKPIVGLLALAALVGSAHAQSVFICELNGGQENPPVVTTQTGLATLYYNNATNALSYSLAATGLTGGFSAAHIHGSSAPGVNSGVLFALVGGPLNFAGTVTLSAAQETSLFSGLLYMNVHSTTFPGGEIRGQIAPATSQFAARLSGANEVPPVPTTAGGLADVRINTNKTVTYTVTFAGLTSNVTAAHIHDGPVGVAGGILIGLTQTGANTFSGTSGVQTDVTLAKIRSGRTYVNVHSTTFPGGEIRGQLRGSWVPYEVGCNLAGAGTLSGSGLPIPGQNITLNIAGSTPSTPGVLFLGFAGQKAPFGFGCDFLIAPPTIFSIGLGVGPTGSLSLPAALAPTTPFPLDLHMQYFGTAPTEPGGFHTTNGLVMHIDG